MTWTLRSLQRFSDKVGGYPYDQLDVAETPAGVGMESPGMIWVDSTIASSRFTYIVVHEMAHQWFYGVVGNNQGTMPFVDEAMADFLTRDLLNSFRSSACARARLDGTVWDYRGRCYPEVIYVQGGLYLRNYREEVGAADFWAGMHNFYVNHKFRIADTRDLLDALDAASGFNSQQHEERFPRLY
jgi:aminopeptidase N